jgi:hypothetical protein
MFWEFWLVPSNLTHYYMKSCIPDNILLDGVMQDIPCRRVRGVFQEGGDGAEVTLSE